MTVIRPNSVSGITSITAQANEINFFRSNGALAGLQLNGVNFNTTTGVSTFNNLDVGGVLTYQDVTNVDSVGIITARSGINCGGDLDITGQYLKIENAASPEIQLTDTNANNSLCFIRNSSGNLRLSADNNNVQADTSIRFLVDGGEKARIDSSGRVLIGTTTEGETTADNLTIADSGHSGITIRSGTSSEGNIFFSDGTSGDAEYRGMLRYEHNNDAMVIKTANVERLRITSDGHLNAGGTVLSISDLNWSPDTYQRPHIFSGITGGNPSDGDIVLASPETNPSNTRIGAVVFGCKTSSNSGVSNSGVKATIEGYTNTNVSDAWKTGSYIKFLTRIDNGNLSEKLRITSEGNIVFGVQGSDTPITNAHIRHIEGGQDYWNSTKGDYRSLRYLAFYGGIDNAYGMGISSSELELQSQQDLGIYAGGSGSNTGRRNLRILLDNSENTLKFQSNTKTAFRGSQHDPQHHAFINMGSNGNTETRAIDMWGSWNNGENKSITFNHGSSVNNIVAQINAIHYGGTPSRTTPHSSLRWGKLYHLGDSTTYTMTLDSTSLTSADLNLKGAYRSPNHPAFCVSGSSMSNFSSLTKIQYTTHGTHGVNQDGFDNANDRFVAPVDGVYHFYARHWYQQSTANSTVWLYFYRNGSQIKENRTSFGSSGPPEYVTVQLSTTVYLSATNYIEVYAQSTNNAFHPSSGSFHTEFSGFLVC